MTGLAPGGGALADIGGGVVVEEEEKMRFCNVGRRRCLVLLA
jgi:hypothetical protein